MAIGIVVTVIVSMTASAASAEAPERFRGRIVDIGSGMTQGGTWWMTFHIDATTPNEDVAALAQTLAADGQKAFIAATRALEPTGWIRIGNNTRWHVSVIRSGVAPDGSRVIRGFTDRPIQMAEIFGSYRTRDYTLGMVELRLDAEGKGSGILLPMAQISFNEAGDIEIESFGNQPFRVMNVSPEKLKEKK
jgi:hypothetical protein